VIESPYLTTDEAASVLRFTGKDARESFLRYAKRQGIPTFRRGRILLVLKSDVLNAVHGKRDRRPRTTGMRQPSASVQTGYEQH
jgi:hypothetical protein